MVIHSAHWLLVALLIAASAGMLLAAQEAGEVVIVRGTIEEDIYVAGRSVDVVAEVQGDVAAAGQRVSIDQSVAGDVLAVGESVTVRAQVQDDVRAAGRSLIIAGSVGGHVVAAGETVSIAPAATVGGWVWLAGREVNVAGRVGKELKAAGQTVIVSGEIGDDVELMAEQIRILAGARINGNLIYRSGNEPQISEDAVITGDIIAEPVPYQEPGGHGGGFIFIGALALAAIVYFLLFPRFSVAGAEGLRRAPLNALGVGVAILFATPFVILLLFATLIGVLVALPLFAYYLVSLLGGLVTGVLYVGDAGLRLLGKAETAAKGLRVLSIMVALVALVLIQIIPVVGALAMLVLFVLGLGALQLQIWRSYSQ
ncbi:MAG: hypothetical protein OEN52_10460 [Gammaproteobacteria bacterium]|nr:hypothetical protein [Gammaproteobacteria bacterium]MDH3561360.1 hypothetical protein [Gammaproteobacteria bacterium]